MNYLIVNRSDSRCGTCNRNADPAESAHVMEHMVGEGCGATYEAVTSDYAGKEIEDAIRAMRPDLRFVSIFARMDGESA